MRWPLCVHVRMSCRVHSPSILWGKELQALSRLAYFDVFILPWLGAILDSQNRQVCKGVEFFLAPLRGLGFNKTSRNLLLWLAGKQCASSPANPASPCNITLMWTTPPLSRALSEGLHANMALTEVTSGESASIVDKIKHYAMSLAINAESDSTALHVFLMRCDRPFIPRLPEQGRPVILTEGAMGRRCERNGLLVQR